VLENEQVRGSVALTGTLVVSKSQTRGFRRGGDLGHRSELEPV